MADFSSCSKLGGRRLPTRNGLSEAMSLKKNLQDSADASSRLRDEKFVVCFFGIAWYSL